MTKIKWFIISFSLLVVILVFSLLAYINYLTANVDCIGNFSISNDVERMSLLVSRKMSNGQGIDTISGGIYRGKTLVARVERTVKYTYEEEEGRYVMLSTSIIKGVHDNITDSQLTGCLSGMYAHRGANNIVVLKNIGRSGWMVYDSPVPLYFCKRNN